MTKRVLITTTINVPENLKSWSDSGFDDDDTIIVAGDKKTPWVETVAFLKTLSCKTLYLHPDHRDFECDEIIGFNSIQRRNIALLEAIKLQPSYITTVDDDNWPCKLDFFENVDNILLDRTERYFINSHKNGWYNIGYYLYPKVTVRGFPYELLHDKSFANSKFGLLNIGVLASLCVGDPDISAIERIYKNPNVLNYSLDRNICFDFGTWCPFNSQSTSYITSFAPLMCVWPGVGRYDDIWSSLLAQRVMHELEYVVSFGYPLAKQKRNKHNLLKDLEDEMFGMKYTLELEKVLRNVDLSNVISPIQMMKKCFRDIEDNCKWMPYQTIEFFHAWCNDIKAITHGECLNE